MLDIHSLKEKFLNFVFPTSCIGCKTQNIVICENCFKSIPPAFNKNINNISIYSYKNSLVNKLLWLLKYHHYTDIAEFFGETMADHLMVSIKNSATIEYKKIYLIPIPLNKGDKRLYNHAQLLAQEIAKNLNNKFSTNFVTVKDVLVKNSLKKQARIKSKKERETNIKDTILFNSVYNTLSKSNKNENILYIIVDDITTTGSTINEGRKVLSKALCVPESGILSITVAH